MNEDQAILRKSFVMGKLAKAAGGRCKKSEFTVKRALATRPFKDLGLDPAAVEEVVGQLVNDQHVAVEKEKKAEFLRLTPTGEEYLKTLPAYPPPPPPKPSKVIKPPPVIDPPAKAFVLMELFLAARERDQQLLRAEIKKLAARAAAKRVGLKAGLVKPLMAALAGEGAVEPADADPGRGDKDDKVSYRLTERGTKALATIPQHEQAEFKLSGRALNELLGLAAPAGATTQASPAAPEGNGAAQGRPVPAARAELTDEALLAEARELFRERFGHVGLVPIFELRRRVREKFGEAAATHEQLDGRIRHLRRERRLRLVSIDDRSQASAEQLSEAIPGEGEIFFYVGDLQ